MSTQAAHFSPRSSTVRGRTTLKPTVLLKSTIEHLEMNQLIIAVSNNRLTEQQLSVKAQ